MADASAGKRDAADALLCGAAALLLYVALGQQTFYKIDGHLYLSYVLNGERSYPRHFLYLPLVFVARDAGNLLGLTLYESARALSATGTALGVALLHLASRRIGLSRQQALLATALCATMPNVVFFATVVEVHGSFLPFVGLAAWCAAGLAQAPTVARAISLGAACALAFCAHSTGALLPALLLPLLLLYPRRPLRAGLLPGIIVAGTLAAGVLASPYLARAIGVTFDLHHAGEFATDRAHRNLVGWERYARTLWTEWLLPLAPLSALLPLTFLAPRLRAAAAWLVVAGAIYLFTTLMILGGEPEYGAYLVPFAWPLALLACRALPRWATLLIAAAQLALAVGLVTAHDDPRLTRAYAQGARALAGDAPITLVLGDDLDLRVLLLHLPEVERVPLFELATLPPATAPAAAAKLQEWIDTALARGRAVLLSDAARTALLRFPTVTPIGRALLEALDARYTGERAPGAAFAGVRLRSR
jgi:hypothetical protein